MASRNPTHAEHQHRLNEIIRTNPDALNWDGPRANELAQMHVGVQVGDPARCARTECPVLLAPWLVEQGIRIHQSCEFPEFFPKRRRR